MKKANESVATGKERGLIKMKINKSVSVRFIEENGSAYLVMADIYVFQNYFRGAFTYTHYYAVSFLCQQGMLVVQCT